MSGSIHDKAVAEAIMAAFAALGDPEDLILPLNDAAEALVALPFADLPSKDRNFLAQVGMMIDSANALILQAGGLLGAYGMANGYVPMPEGALPDFVQESLDAVLAHGIIPVHKSEDEEEAVASFIIPDSLEG